MDNTQSNCHHDLAVHRNSSTRPRGECWKQSYPSLSGKARAVDRLVTARRSTDNNSSNTGFANLTFQNLEGLRSPCIQQQPLIKCEEAGAIHGSSLLQESLACQSQEILSRWTSPETRSSPYYLMQRP
ncbi:Hypothetical predicted protein [Lynx pardinus]|uniref:Uncharacterized protein n=1 Tax=Lynx pardinus TaxID=191816 RepID=A0A485PL05_LYNPA|nr:Hypothetical predicted protein [Lynx pardinus]